MPARADVQNSHLLKLLLIALVMAGFSLLFLKDGWFKYPQDNVVRAAYDEAADDVDNPVPLGDRWAAITAENGWSKKVPEAHEDHEILLQKAIFFVLLGLSGYVFFGWFKNRSRHTFTTEEGVGDHTGRFAKWDQISEFDDRRWDKKGIILLRYTDDAGKASKIVLDDYVMDTQPTRTMVDEIKAELGIESDKPEADGASEDASEASGEGGEAGASGEAEAGAGEPRDA